MIILVTNHEQHYHYLDFDDIRLGSTQNLTRGLGDSEGPTWWQYALINALAGGDGVWMRMIMIMTMMMMMVVYGGGDGAGAGDGVDADVAESDDRPSATVIQIPAPFTLNPKLPKPYTSKPNRYRTAGQETPPSWKNIPTSCGRHRNCE